MDLLNRPANPPRSWRDRPLIASEHGEDYIPHSAGGRQSASSDVSWLSIPTMPPDCEPPQRTSSTPS